TTRRPLVLTSCFYQSPRHRPALPSFPTRRSSDLAGALAAAQEPHADAPDRVAVEVDDGVVGADDYPVGARAGQVGFQTHRARDRSEEHTSELQSLRHLVCRLLLEKKNGCIAHATL